MGALEQHEFKPIALATTSGPNTRATMADLPEFETTLGTSERRQLPPLFQSCGNKHSFAARLFYIFFGSLLMVLGVIGWLLPFVPGVPILIFGISLIAISTPGGVELINRCEERLPFFLRKCLRRDKKTHTSESKVSSLFQAKDV
jgi:hypothetical protein